MNKCACYTGISQQCGQVSCESPASYSFHWPGKKLSFICETHAPMLLRIAENMGLDVLLTKLPEWPRLTTEDIEPEEEP